MKTSNMAPYHRRTVPVDPLHEVSPDRARLEWPKIMHTVMTGECNEHAHNSKTMTVDTVTIADARSVYPMGTMTVHTVVEKDIVGRLMRIRYTWKVNGVPVRALEFETTKEGRLGRLVAEYNTTISKMKRTEVPHS